MRLASAVLACLMLIGCSSGADDGDSDEAEIRNAAGALENAANADANRMIAEIEANTPKPADEVEGQDE
jgi:hypothetical protein